MAKDESKPDSETKELSPEDAEKGKKKGSLFGDPIFEV